MNSISMSVSAKIKQYGAMRAVGMEDVINVSLPLVLPFSLNGLYFNIPAIFKVSLPTVTVSPSCKGRLSS